MAEGTARESSNLLPREVVLSLTPSRIREVANAALHRDDVIALWFGESDQATPSFIIDAAIEAMRAGSTKYAHNLGIPALRQAIADYLNALHAPPAPVGAERVAVTSSGVSALMLAAQCLLGPGDRAVVLTPHWPNIGEIPRILSARLELVALELRGERWELDLDKLLRAITPEVKVAWINSPNNPTGFTLDRAGQHALLEHCRKLGVWLVADEVYSRLYYAGDSARPVAPSFLDIAEPRDKLVVVNSFSKAWVMTGWRLGWLVAPECWMPHLANVIEYNTSCATTFVQHAAVAALHGGESFVRESVARYRAGRDLVHRMLSDIPGVVVPKPDGAFYTFFRADAARDSLALAKRILAETGVGFAPGIAFGPAGEGHLRLCFANQLSRLEEALGRVARLLAARRT